MPKNNTSLFSGENSTGYTAAGVTTLLFGTDGYLQSPFPGTSYAGTGYYIVESIRERTLAEKIHIENGSGIVSSRIILNSGTQWDVTLQDDSGIPAANFAINGNVALCAFTKTNGGATASSVYTGVVVDTNYDAARKTPAKRVVTIENLTLVDSQTASAAD